MFCRKLFERIFIRKNNFEYLTFVYIYKSKMMAKFMQAQFYVRFFAVNIIVFITGSGGHRVL